jgi:hypothetical protein
MIGSIVTKADGTPSDSYTKLSKSSYHPIGDVAKLWQMIQTSYQTAYLLQHRPYKEFDGVSLLERAKLDQETFAAYVGAEYVPEHKRWRWRGRKNTSRNKLIGLCARMLAGMLYPTVYANNEDKKEDKMAARVMRIRIESHLKKAGYETKFLFMIMSALVNPAVFVQVEWVEMMQKIKEGGKVEEIINETLSGLVLNILPIDEIMLPDFYSGTGNLNRLNCILRVRRIPWDEARAKWAGKYYTTEAGIKKDLFDYVQAGMTRIFITGNENQELFDIEWTEADKTYVQEITAYYSYEDLEVPVVGGVLMVNEENVYNNNPFTHRRYTLVKDEWKSVPVLPFVASGFEPLDPTGRFFYYKSGAFKEFWDDKSINTMHRLAHDGTFLDVIKPTILTGVAKVDSTVMVPGGTFGLPAGAGVSQYSLGPNLNAVWQAVNQYDKDLSDSTTVNPVPQPNQPNISATQTNVATMQAKLFISIFALLVADLIKRIGELVVDCEINYAMNGEIDANIPGHLNLKERTSLIKSKEKGKNMTHKIVFTSKHMGKKYTDKQIEDKEWQLYNESGKTLKERLHSSSRTYEVNPYQYAKLVYEVSVDADQIVDKSMGADQQRKVLAFNMMTDPRVAPYTDQEAVVDDFVIEEFGGDNPDKYKKKQQLGQPDMLNSIMGGQNGQANQFKLGGGAVVPSQNNQPNMA